MARRRWSRIKIEMSISAGERGAVASGRAVHSRCFSSDGKRQVDRESTSKAAPEAGRARTSGGWRQGTDERERYLHTIQNTIQNTIPARTFEGAPQNPRCLSGI